MFSFLYFYFNIFQILIAFYNHKKVLNKSQKKFHFSQFTYEMISKDEMLFSSFEMSPSQNVC